MALDRTWYNTLANDDGSNTVGSPWDKEDVDALMDAVDAVLGGSVFALGATAAANALTIALLSKTGGTPSASDPVDLVFRNVTVGSGTLTTVSVQAAATLVIPDTALMGATNGVPFRLWIVAFNDGGTVRLGVINCATASSLFPLAGWGVASSTAITTGADSAQVFYTGSAVTAKAYAVLGYVNYEAGLATAGTYASAPTRIQPFLPDTPLPGAMLQHVFASYATQATSSSATPADTGLTATLTPRSAANRVLATVQQAGVAKENNTSLALLLIRGATTIIQFANTDGNTVSAATNSFGSVGTQWLDAPGSTADQVYKTQFTSGAGIATTYVQYNGARSTMLLQELQG